MVSVGELWNTLSAIPWLLDALVLAGLWTGTVLAVRYNGRFFAMVAETQRQFAVAPRSLHHLNRVCDVFLLFIATMFTLYLLGVGRALWGALTALGVAGIVIGFAAKDLASNLISGLIILFDNPFAPGDYVEVGSMAGTVEEVRLRSTTLRTSDGLALVVPNTEFITKPVKNYTINPVRRVDVVVTISHETDLDQAVAALQDAAKGIEARIEDRPIQVHITEIQEYRVMMRLRFWVGRADYAAARSQVQKAITEGFRREGIELAIPLRKTVKAAAAAQAPAAVDGDEDEDLLLGTGA